MGSGDYLAIEDVMTYQLHHGNCIDIMPLIDRESVDAIVTDPPYGLGFMGKDWDHGVPGEHFWREAYRCVKPGAYLLAFGGTRTFHRLAVAIEDAGWEIRDTVMWVYGQGFPKSHDVSKAIDREAGAEREVIGGYMHGGTRQSGIKGKDLGQVWHNETAPSTEAAAEWDGWGTALKPAWEPIIVARKPLQGTVAENVQRYGTGAMNIDGCRIEAGRDYFDAGFGPRYGETSMPQFGGNQTRPYVQAAIANGEPVKDSKPNQKGRWPSNLIHDGSAEVLAGFPMTTQSNARRAKTKLGKRPDGTWNAETCGYIGTGDGWGISDTGSAARFFYCAKASKQDRDEGLEGLEEVLSMRYGEKEQGPSPQQTPSRPTLQRNHHPTVKPTALMRYLCRLVTPPNGTILDLFMGSGSTGKAAMLEGFNFIGIDTEIEYVEIAARRIEHACEKVGIVIEQPMMFETQRETVDKPKQLILL